MTAAAALAFAATAASAEGLLDRGSVKDAPYAAPAHIRSGLSVGAGVGYGVGTSTLTNGTEADDASLRGAQGVVAVGYDWQVGPKLVLGILADYAFGQLDGTLAADLTIEKQWAIGGRLGVLATPSTLLYASAGYTRADFEVISDLPGLLLADRTLDGIFLGLGVEQALTRNIALKLDYRFSNYQDFKDATSGLRFDNEVHSVRLGVNWRFGRDDRPSSR